MGQTVRTGLERIGLNPALLWAMAIVAVTLVVQYAGLLRDSEQQKELVVAVSALTAGLNAEQEARKLLELQLRNLADRGAERTSRRDADIAALNGRLSTLEGKTASLQLDVASALARIEADLRAIKDRLGNRAAVVAPQRAG